MSFNWPHSDMEAEYESGFYKTGATEPWIAQILYSLIVAKQEPLTIIETGGYVGTTSAWLAAAAKEVGGRLTVCEVDIDRAKTIEERLHGYGYIPVLGELSTKNVAHVQARDALTVIDRALDGVYGFAWVDDDHDRGHVAYEIAALMDKMAPKGIIAMHDVYGVTDLAGLCKQFGGIPLDFPRIGPGGGLGLIQV